MCELPQSNNKMHVLTADFSFLHIFYRYLSHFRSVHRGAYFAELRTTTVRKLMPEAWGFLCPVHTPDGSPCGLLNHFSAMCRLVTKRPESLEDTEVAINMVSHCQQLHRCTAATFNPVCIIFRLISSYYEESRVLYKYGLQACMFA